MLTSGKGVFVFSFQGLELFSLVEGIIKDLVPILHKQTFKDIVDIADLLHQCDPNGIFTVFMFINTF